MKKWIAIFLALASIGFAADIPEPYCSIIDLPFDDHGWFINERQLADVLASRNPKTAIEIGSWLGSSARFIASHMPPDGILYTVDTWRGSENYSLQQNDPRISYLFQLFLSNVKQAELTHKIVPIRMNSIEASKALDVMADLIYVDADHETKSVEADILHWYPHLKNGGLMCGDDWQSEAVQLAVLECAQILNKVVRNDNNFWWYE